MNPDTIQFQCGFCRTILTVPAQMAGVTGPCPSCGQTVTSPMSAPAAAQVPQWSPAPVSAPAPVQAPPPAWPPTPPSPSMGEMPGMGIPSPNLGLGLPPKRAPGQPPLSSALGAPGSQPPWASSPAAPAAMPSQASHESPAGFPGSLPNQSRFIPGAPALPNMSPMGGTGGGMPHSLPGSLLGRDVSPAPSSPHTQPLQPMGAPSLSLGGALGHDPAFAAQAPMPAPRNIASLRAPRGTNFIRLAFAAVFLLGFLGLVGYLLKDQLIGMFPNLVGHDMAEEVSKEDTGIPTPPLPTPDPSTPSNRANGSMAQPAPSSEASSAPHTKPAPIAVGFDPQEPAAPKTPSATAPEQIAAAIPIPPPPAAAMPAEAAQPPSAAGTLLEVPAKSAMSAGSTGAPPVSPSSLAQSHTVEEEDIRPEAKPAIEALKKFLSAKTVEERLQYTLGAEVMKPLMERYYSRAPDGPVLVDRIQFVRIDPKPDFGSGKHCIFSLENKTWEFSVPVMLEEKEDGFKVDWVSFVEFKDRMLEKFFQTYQTGKACFHVGIMRHHYFGGDVPNVDHKDAFRVSPAPPNSFQASVFIDENNPLAEELRVRVPWETHVWAVVELEWKKLGSQQWVELSAVPQMHWYSLPMAANAPAGTPAPKAPGAEELPPGISKNGSRGKSVTQSSGNNIPPPGIRKSTPDLPTTIKRPIPAGR